MKIKRVDDKPIVLHTKKKPKLKIKKKDKKYTSKRSFTVRSRKGMRKRLELKDGSVKVKNHRLKNMMRTGGRTATKQLDGGDEVLDSMDVAAMIASPVVFSVGKTKDMAKQRAIKKATKKKRRKRNRMISSEEYAKNSLHVKTRSERAKRTGGKDGKDKKGEKQSGFVKNQMMQSFFQGLSREGQEEQGNIIEGTKNMVRAAALMVGKTIATTVLPFLLLVFLVVASVGGIVSAVLGAIYNSPFAIFFPTPDTGYDSPRTVLSGYYREFNEELRELEEDGAVITYQNMEDGVAVTNFNDTLMVYMTLYGSGEAAYVMDEDGKKNLKTVFDAMNYYDNTSTTKTIKAGESLGDVVVTGYCSCSICCGSYAGGNTASGTKPKANHTIAVDADNPIVPMGTKVVMNGKTYKVEDTGNLKAHGTDFDIYFKNHKKALQWGKKTIKAHLADGKKNDVEITTNDVVVHNLTYEDYINLGTMTEEQEKTLLELMDGKLVNSMYSGDVGGNVAALAMTKIGCAYSKEKRMCEGFYDCSSLVYRLYKECGVELPSIAADQGEYCYKNAMLVNKKDLKPGDLVFYSYETNGRFRNISHVAIYVGDGKIVHAANPSRGVVMDNLPTSSVVFYARPW